MSLNINNPKSISEKGVDIYNSHYRKEYESKYLGKFVAIEVFDESATLGDTADEALLKAKVDHPAGLFHLIRIGHSGAFEVGLRYKKASPDRLHQIATGSQK